jgi:hypothetical protein
MGIHVAKAHYEVLQKYVLNNTFKGTIQYFICKGGGADRQRLRRLWADYATGGQRLIPVPGKHGTFHKDPQFSVVVAELRKVLVSE